MSGTMHIGDHASFPMNLWKKRGEGWSLTRRTMEDACVGRLESCNECIRLEIQWRCVCGSLWSPGLATQRPGAREIVTGRFAGRLLNQEPSVPLS
jgi:hypothetical protein